MKTVATLHELARKGVLAATAAAASPPERVRLTSAAYELAAPIVYQRLTHRIEASRGHRTCASSVQGLMHGCLDRYHDDVESVVDHILTRANKPIHNLEAWVARCVPMAAVNGYRKRRGQRGAPQRPRLPGWLVKALRHDRWLTTLATDLLEWVGLDTTAGTSTWPMDAWAVRRAEVTGDWAGSGPATVMADVDQVLAAMRSRPEWYDSHVEAPLGRKQAPVAPPAPPGGEHMPLSLAELDATEDTHLCALATDALAQIEARLTLGEDPWAVVVEVVGRVFESDTGQHELNCPPHAAPPYEERVRALLAEPGTVPRIVDTVLSIIADE